MTDAYIPVGFDGDIIRKTSQNEAGTVSIGDVNGFYGPSTTRRITSLAAGRDDTDAVNVTQLKGLGEAVSSVIGGGVSFTDGRWNGKVNVNGTDYASLTEAIETLSGTGGGSDGGVSAGNNINITTDDTGTQKVHLKDDIKLNSAELAVAKDIERDGMHAATTGQVHSIGNSIAGLFGGNFAVDASGTIANTNQDEWGFSVGDKSGLTLQEALNEAANSGGTGGGITLTQGNNIEISQNGSEYTVRVSDNPNFSKVTAESVSVGGKVNISSGGIDMGGTSLTGLADGGVYQGSSDAVTGGQLWDTYQRMGTMENNIYREMDDLREDVNVVGAHAAALSGLHPIQYNPYEPTTLSAAIGTYHDEYAVAVGVFHYTRENVMFNLGASLCSDGDVMGRAGVSFAVGKSSDKKPRLASTMGGLQKQVIDMQAKLDGLEEKNARNEEIIKQNAEIMAQNEKLIRELTKRLEAKN